MGDSRLFHADLTAGRLRLSREESHHVRDVLRARADDHVVLFDGEGREAQGRIVGLAKNGVEIEVSEVALCPNVASIRLTLATAMPRAQRQAFLFEKCTELGVWSIWPTIYERSVVKPSGATHLKSGVGKSSIRSKEPLPDGRGSERADTDPWIWLRRTTRPAHIEKWRRTTIEACKQCGRAWLPRIEGPYTFAETIARAGEFDRRIVTDADSAFAPLRDAVGVADDNSRPPDAAPVTLLVWIGPEGGLTLGEINGALSAGAVGGNLGRHTLRTETAALAVSAMVTLPRCSS